MDHRTRFGDQLMFWGGMDVQQFLPTASPQEVRQRVRDLTATLGRCGGYVRAPAHNIQDDVPPPSIVAWIEEARASEQRSVADIDSADRETGFATDGGTRP
jgi:uroporphyrinogen decarboxylase